jgi:creatinine amidohydrolase
MLLEHSTWPEIESYLKRSTGILIPTGSIEQHGPSGPIATDAICAEAIARRAGALGDILVGPTVALGVAQFNLGFPGTVSVRAATLMAVIGDYIRSLARQGFDRFYVLNGHGGNIAPIHAAFQDLHGEASYRKDRGNEPGLRCRLRSWWEYETVNRMRHALYGEWEGLHATPSEIAIAQHARPEVVRQVSMPKPERLPEATMRELAGDRHRDAGHHRSRFPDGRIGADSSLATPEAGERLLAAAAEDAVEDYRRFVEEA